MTVRKCLIGLRDGAIRHRDVLLALLLVLFTLAVGSMMIVPGITGVFHDDGIYVSTARALAEGEGYRLINLPGAPLQTKYPPLYPALLAVIWHVCPSFPENVLVMQWLTLFISACSVGLCYYYVVTSGYFSRPVALIAGLLAASSHAALYYSTLLLSEMPFALFLCAALLALERHAKAERQSTGGKWLLALVVAMPFLTRSVGIVLLPAALLFLIVRRRFSWLFTSAVCLIACGWFAWTLQARQSSPITYYYTSYVDWWRDYMSPGVLARVSLFNFIDAVYSLLYAASALTGKLVSVAPRLWPIVTLFAIPAIPGFWRDLREPRLLPWLLVFYFAIVLIWPWPPFRFVIPVLAFLICYVIDGLRRLLVWIVPMRAVVPVAVVLAAFLVLANVQHTRAVAAFNHAVRYPTMSTTWENPAGWPSFLDVFSWIKKNTSPHDVVAGYFDSMIFLYTNRQAFRPLVVTPASPNYGVKVPIITPDALFRSIRSGNGRYVVCTPFDRFGGSAPLGTMVERIGLAHPGTIKRVHTGKDRRFVIYRIEKP